MGEHGILEGLTEEKGGPGKPAWLLAFLVLLAMALRLLLFRYHQIIEGDGVHYAALARIISRQGSLEGAASEYWSNLWPLVIAAFDVFVRDIELAGRLASAVFGSLTILPVYLVCREFLNKRASIVAAALVAAQPFLLRFSVLLYTESFYTFLLAWVLWMGIRMIKSPDRLERWLSFGLLVGAGLWTRPEIQIPAVFFVIVALGRSVIKRPAFKKALSGMLIFGAVIIVSLSSRALLIHHYLGKWHFGFAEKAAVNIKMGILSYDHSQSEKFLNTFEDGRFVNLWQNETALLPFLWENRALAFNRMKINAGQVLKSWAAVLAPTKGIPLQRRFGMGLLLLGILTALIWKKTRSWALLFILLLPIYSFPWLLAFVLDRFVVPLAVVAVIFTAAGLIILESGAAALVKRPRLTAWPVLSLLIVVWFGMRTVSWARHDRSFVWESDPVVQKEAGLYLKEHFPQETRILTWGPHIPYYFYEGNPYERCLQNIPYASYDEVMGYVRREKLVLLVLPEWLLLAADFPIKTLAAENARAEGLDFVQVIGEKKPERVWIYRVI